MQAAIEAAKAAVVAMTEYIVLQKFEMKVMNIFLTKDYDIISEDEVPII